MENKETLEKGKLPTTPTGASKHLSFSIIFESKRPDQPSGSATQQSRYAAPDSPTGR